MSTDNWSHTSAQGLLLPEGWTMCAVGAPPPAKLFHPEDAQALPHCRPWSEAHRVELTLQQ